MKKSRCSGKANDPETQVQLVTHDHLNKTSAETQMIHKKRFWFYPVFNRDTKCCTDFRGRRCTTLFKTSRCGGFFRTNLLCLPDGGGHVFKVVRLFFFLIGWRGDGTVATFDLNTCGSIFVPGAPVFNLWLCNKVRCGVETSNKVRYRVETSTLSAIFVFTMDTRLTCFCKEEEKSTVVGRVIWSPLSLRPLPLLDETFDVIFVEGCQERRKESETATVSQAELAWFLPDKLKQRKIEEHISTTKRSSKENLLKTVTEMIPHLSS